MGYLVLGGVIGLFLAWSEVSNTKKKPNLTKRSPKAGDHEIASSKCRVATTETAEKAEIHAGKAITALQTGGVFVLTTAVALITLVSYSRDEPAQRPRRPATIPAYRIVTTRDLSILGVRRLEARVSLPEHYARDEVERVAQAVVAELTSLQNVNAISINFYGPHASTDGAYDVAMVEWAPNGCWTDAKFVRAGDYSTFRYSVSYKAPPAALPSGTARLAESGRTGLLGLPLPEGAKLMEQIAGDVAAERDPSESYAVSASAAQIMAFFYEAMPKAGWAKYDAPLPMAVFFRKGALRIVVIANKDGGSFTLMGS